MVGISSKPIFSSARFTSTHDIHSRSDDIYQHDSEKKDWGDIIRVDKKQKLEKHSLLSMAAETLSNLFQSSDGDKTAHEQQREYKQLRRKTMYLPPAPVTPFRGGLKSVPEKDDHDHDGEIKPSEDLLEANSSDHADDEGYPGVTHSTHPSISSSKSGSSSSWAPTLSWAPEDYPDPWTNPILCGGAATASLLSSEQEYQEGLDFPPQQQSEMQTRRRPLFCDPDQVLDKETLGNVAVKLRAFAETFAFSETVMEGGDWDFGTDAEDELSNENPANDENQEDISLATEEGDPSRRLLRSAYSTDKRLYSDSAGGLFSTTHRKTETANEHKIEVAIALVQKINLPAILRADSYFFYSDQDDMVNDAAQYFARYIHDTWSKRLTEADNAPTNIVLIFISTLDRICYISSGTRIAAILPWWRLEHVVQDMKQDLRKGQTGDALNVAIEELTALLLEGPPSFTDRVNDFFQRFGIVMLFTISTFLFATWGECRDRRKRIFFVERRSRMTAAEKQKARLLQQGFATKMCPICLEPFDLAPDKDTDAAIQISPDKEKSPPKQKQKMKRVDSLGVPLMGADDQPIKMLRCGHIFDETCWSMWVNSGHGNPMICPVCRQDVGRTKRGSTITQRNDARGGGDGEDARGRESPSQEESSLFTRMVANTNMEPSMLANYSSIPPQAQRETGAPFAHPAFRRLRPMFGLSTTPPTEGIGEQTPLFAQTSTGNEESDDDY